VEAGIGEPPDRFHLNQHWYLQGIFQFGYRISCIEPSKSASAAFVAF